MLVISTKKAVLIILSVSFCLSLLANGWMIYLIWQTTNAFQTQQTNNDVLSFTDMFVEKILMANKEIDFDTRLELETTVRSLNDSAIFEQWQAFTKAETKEDASNRAKQLLNLLVKKIRAQK